MLPWRGYHINPSPFIFSLINSFQHISLSLSCSPLLSPLFGRTKPRSRRPPLRLGATTGRPPLLHRAPPPHPSLSLSLPSFSHQPKPPLADPIKPRPAPPRSVLIHLDSNRRFHSRVRFDLGSKEIRSSIRNLYLFDQRFRWTNWRP